MSQAPEKGENRSATERAEELLDRAGRRLGLFLASTGQRMQRATKAGERPAAKHSPESLNGKKPGQEEISQATMERADLLVGQMEVRIRRFTTLLSLHIQKTTARLREEAEDMWAEAQHIRSQDRHNPHK